MSRFLCGCLEGLKPYVPGEQPQDKSYIKLNTNESPFPPAPGVEEAVRAQAGVLNLYSDPDGLPLKRALGALYGLGERNVSLGNGSDENLAHIFAAFLQGRGAAFPDVTYGFYPVLCSLMGIAYKTVPLCGDFTVNTADYAAITSPVVLANPNAQTGIYLTAEQIEELVLQNAGRLVIIDEAYIDFGGQSCAPLVKKYDNLIVVQTMSKSRSLAGARLGFSFACEELTAEIEAVRCSLNPYNVNRMTMAAAQKSLAEPEYFAECTKNIASVREYTATKLKNMGFEVLPSRANFLLARHPEIGGGALYERLKAGGVLVRHFGGRIEEFIRVTVGTRAQTDVFLALAGRILAEVNNENG